MSRKYKMHNKEGMYFVSFAVIGWIDVFTRKEYRDLLIDNLKYCVDNKGLYVFAWCIMSNHVHLIIQAKKGIELARILGDFKKYTSKTIIKAIQNHPQESRKEWMLAIFKKAGKYNSNNKNFQFWRQDNRPIELYTEKVIRQKFDYIHNNPVKDEIVQKPEEYIYSSAKDYYLDENGLLPIESLKFLEW